MEQIKPPQFELLDNAVVIAITGGIGSGKSEAARIFRELGRSVISTDELAKVVMNTDNSVKKQIISTFGSNSYNSDGVLSAGHISSTVFSGNESQSDNLQKLNLIVHPPVIELMISEIEKTIEAGEKLVFVESALIYESALDEGFDYIICITADDDLRIQRVRQRSGISEEQIIQRMKEQISQEEKIKLSDFEIENNKSINDLKNSINFLLPILESLPPKKSYSSDFDSGK
ncbi:MAG: dephospho-CoA kinase [Candidatus Kapabacteria bacterium]|nr:dephospho-CoA kinase [Candidatus Kapabacteria bacterium]